MFDVLWNIGAFVVALGTLVAVHEWGHFIVARKCGVKVERFSIGFGKPLWRKFDRHGTEFVVAAIPLGGYVRMLDGRVDDVPPELASQAFNNKSVGQRMAIIVAGPAINFIFAAIVLLAMYMIGLTTVKPVVGEVAPTSIAAQAGLQPGDEIVAIGERSTLDWEAVNLELIGYIGNQHLPITVIQANGVKRERELAIENWQFDPETSGAVASLGITPFRPEAKMEVGVVGKDSAASRAGLEVGDKILRLNGETITDWTTLVELIRDAGGQTVTFDVDRAGQTLPISATIDRRETSTGMVGYLGVSPVFEPWPEGYVFTHQYNVLDAFGMALDKTWRLTTLSVEMIGKLIVGDVSVKNLSGPISIAQGAGVSASYGLVYFLSFLALISVNLGVINLLPLPMLDGGHLLYFMVEWVRGKPVSEATQEWGFRIGGALLLMIMTIAIVNDITRLT